MDDMYVGSILLWALDYAPKDWAFCNGALLPVAQNMALFALLGTRYGGDGITTFALPDLRGRVPVGVGAGPGLTARALNDKGGVEQVTLLASQMPNHTHPQLVAGSTATTATPSGNVPAPATGSVPSTGESVEVLAYGPATNLQAAAAGGIGAAGGGLPFETMPPFLGLNYIICTTGLYPSRP